MASWLIVLTHTPVGGEELKTHVDEEAYVHNVGAGAMCKFLQNVRNNKLVLLLQVERHCCSYILFTINQNCVSTVYLLFQQ